MEWLHDAHSDWDYMDGASGVMINPKNYGSLKNHRVHGLCKGAVAIPFDDIIAAQLFAESLLALATAPLHAAAETAALEDLRERCAQRLEYPLGNSATNMTDDAELLDLADELRALPLRSGEAAR